MRDLCQALRWVSWWFGYDNTDLDNGNDYMKVLLGAKPDATVNYYSTYINPEIVESDGCYKGDY